MDESEKATALGAVPLFSRVGRSDLERLAKTAAERHYSAGQEIVTQGELGVAMFVITHGEAEAVQTLDGSETHLASLKAGDFFGEMALFDDFPRSATVRASTDVDCIAITQWDLHAELRLAPPVAVQLLKTAFSRLREMNDELVRLKGGSPDVSV